MDKNLKNQHISAFNWKGNDEIDWNMTYFGDGIVYERWGISGYQIPPVFPSMLVYAGSLYLNM